MARKAGTKKKQGPGPGPGPGRGKGKGGYMISAVAQMYDIHPQTLRLYEREGLLRPSRSEGNTRLYTGEDLKRLEMILNLTRDMGVNLAGIEIILNMRERMGEMQREMQRFVEFVRRAERSAEAGQLMKNALVTVRRPRVVKTVKTVQARGPQK